MSRRYGELLIGIGMLSTVLVIVFIWMCSMIGPGKALAALVLGCGGAVWIIVGLNFLMRGLRKW